MNHWSWVIPDTCEVRQGSKQGYRSALHTFIDADIFYGRSWSEAVPHVPFRVAETALELRFDAL